MGVFTRKRDHFEPIDWPKKCAEAEVKLAFALGFLRTIPDEEQAFEEVEAWYERLTRFLAQFDGLACDPEAHSS